MQWHSAADFFAMDGYGLYIWGAYGLTALCCSIEPILAQRRLQQALRAAADGHDHEASRETTS